MHTGPHSELPPAAQRPGAAGLLRILLVSEDLPGDQVGGLGKHVVTLGNALLARGHSVRILGRSDCAPGAAARLGFCGAVLPGFDFAHPGWKEQQLGMFNPLKRPYFARKIARAIMRLAGQFDVVHYHGHLPLVGQYLAPQINFVQTRHDQGSECLVHLRFRDGACCTAHSARACAGCIGSGAGPVRATFSALAVNAYREASARVFASRKTVFVSDFLRRQFLRAVPGADLSRCRVIPNFVNYARLREVARAAPAPVAGTVALVGRLDQGKGFGAFLAAATAPAAGAGARTAAGTSACNAAGTAAGNAAGIATGIATGTSADNPAGNATGIATGTSADDAAVTATGIATGISTGNAAGTATGNAAAASNWRLPPHAHLFIAGDGPERSALAARFAGPRISFLGWQEYGAALALTARSHLCVVPSLCEEACSSTVLEALALGRPVLALARGGTPELAACQQYPGQLVLCATMNELVARLGAALGQIPQRTPLAERFAADTALILPQLVDLYGQ